jgi:hypothetical protein
MDKTIYNKSNSIRYGQHWLLIALLSLLLISSYREKPSNIRILFVGDILLSRNVKEEFNSRKTFPWDDLKPFFQEADLVIGNLEGSVGSTTEMFDSITGSPVFAIDSNDIANLNNAGFQVITIENNHILDLGKKGKKQTISTLLNNNIKPVCFENSPYFITIKDITLSIVTINLIPNRDGSLNQITSVELKQKLRLAQSLSNIVLVSIHWGSELLDWPNKSQKEVAHWLISNGADIIIGSHPHIIQMPEIIDGKPVYFSLGNHLFDQKYMATKEGLIAEIIIDKNTYQCNGIKTHTKQNSFYPTMLDNSSFNVGDFEYNIESLAIDKYTIRPLSVFKGDEDMIILQAVQNEKTIWNSHPLNLVSISSNKLDGVNDYLFALEKHYSSLDNEVNIRPYVYSIDSTGLYARWRGSALAWPLIDAQISPYNDSILCGLHRGDSYISPDKTTAVKRVAAYKWNGFGFTGLNDSIACEVCKHVFE